MADTEKKTLEKLKKLMAAQREVLEKFNLLAAEIDEVLSGGASIGQRIKAVQHAFGDAWSARYRGTPYVWNFAKDTAQIKRLLRTLPADEIGRRAVAYVQSSEPFYMNAQHGFGLFVVSINQWSTAGDAPGDLELEDDVAATKARLAAMRTGTR